MIKKNILAMVVMCLLTACNSGNANSQPQQGAQSDSSSQTAQTAAVEQSKSLPEAITNFLQEQFPGAKIARVKTDNEMGGTEYEVTLNDGTEVDFDTNHQWEAVDCHAQAVPATLVPGSIAGYVKANYQSVFITKVEKKDYNNGYEIELSNGLELAFDVNGNFLGQDD